MEENIEEDTLLTQSVRFIEDPNIIEVADIVAIDASTTRERETERGQSFKHYQLPLCTYKSFNTQ